MATTIQTAFGKTLPVEVLHYGNQVGSVYAVHIRLPGGCEAWVKSTSLTENAPEPVAPVAAVDLEPGLYEQDGSIYKVQISKTSGKAYAKRLITFGGKRLMGDGEKANLEYEYAPGAARSLRPENKMDLEAAKRFGIEYGFCVRCGAFLRDADSVEAGIGPVCRKWFA